MYEVREIRVEEERRRSWHVLCQIQDRIWGIIFTDPCQIGDYMLLLRKEVLGGY